MLLSLVSPSPDTATMLWDLAKIVFGASVTLISPLLVWLGRLVRRYIKNQEELARSYWGEDQKGGALADVRAHGVKIEVLEEWKRETQRREQFEHEQRTQSLRPGGRS